MERLCAIPDLEHITAEAAYVGNKGTHVFAGEGPDYDPNQPTLVGFAQGLSTDQRKPFYGKFGWIQGFRYFGNDADIHYNSLQTKVEKRFSNSYSLLAHYTFSHAKNHESAYYTIDSNVNYGRPEWQRDHVFVASNIYELPFGNGKAFLTHASRGVDLVVGGWQLAANVVLMSGQGFTASYANCGADQDVNVCRPDLVGSTSVSNQNRDHWYQGADAVLANNAKLALKDPNYFVLPIGSACSVACPGSSVAGGIDVGAIARILEGPRRAAARDCGSLSPLGIVEA
ncbi:MAG: hypothetical protein ACR2IV_13140 [Bryobacteraceae bacterium]